MIKVNARALLIIVLVATSLALALVNASRGFSLGMPLNPGRSALAQEFTPTPASLERSQPGSTTGIEGMALLIVAIIVLPIVLTKTTWRKA